MNATTTTLEPFAYRPTEAAKVLRMSRGALYNEIAAGRLEARKRGKSTLILRTEIERYLAALPLKSGDAA
jgi:excisionase family DNA binding protein